MSFDAFQGEIEEKNGEKAYVNDAFNVKLKLVDMCPLGNDGGSDICFKAEDVLDVNLGEVDMGEKTFGGLPPIVHRPSTIYIQKQDRFPFSLGICLVKVLLNCLFDKEDEYEEAAVTGVQFFYDKLRQLTGIDLNSKYYWDLRLITIFLENVPDDVLEQFIQEMLEMPLFVFLKTEISKINEVAAQELFSTTRHRYLTIDTCFFIVKNMKQSFFFEQPDEIDHMVEVKMRECSKVVMYNVPELDVNELYVMPQLGDSSNLNRRCLQELINNNVKMYVTFNERGDYFRISQQERDLYNHLCRAECEFYSIPIEDYRVATEKQLLEFWNIVDRYSARKTTEPDVKFVMHCTSGNGRSTWMLISYLMKQMVDKNGSDITLGPIIQAFKVMHGLCASGSQREYSLDLSSDEEVDPTEYMFDNPFFLDKDSGCPNALMRFQEEYSLYLAEMYTMDLLTQVIRNTPTMKRIRGIIEDVNSHAVNEVFRHSSSEGEDLYFLFLKWIFTIVKTILHINSSSAPSRKKRK